MFEKKYGVFVFRKRSSFKLDSGTGNFNPESDRVVLVGPNEGENLLTEMKDRDEYLLSNKGYFSRNGSERVKSAIERGLKSVYQMF